MNTIDNGKNFETRLVALKAKFYDLTRKVASRGFKERENVFRNTQDLNVPATEMAPRIELFKKDRPAEWVSQMKTTDNGTADTRANYVLRPRLSWTGLYGKEPWPRERKQWEKI